MKLWFDTEFIEDGQTIDLISIGIVREDGRAYYAESCEARLDRADEWVTENVIPHLSGPRKWRSEIAAEIVEFAGDSPEWWAYYADYDWVVLCQLYGRMIDLPGSWPMFCRDIRQLADGRNADLHSIPNVTEHNALADAWWNRSAWELLALESPVTSPSQPPNRPRGDST